MTSKHPWPVQYMEKAGVKSDDEHSADESNQDMENGVLTKDATAADAAADNRALRRTLIDKAVQ